MSNSPINFGAGFLGSAVSGFSSKKNAGKIRKRISKLENQVGAMISKQNQGPTQVEQPIEIQPEPQLGVVPQAFDGSTEEEPELFDEDLSNRIVEMLEEAIEVESQFAQDVLSGGVAGMSAADTRTYLEFVADQRLAQLGLPKRYGSKNPFDFMELQDVQELTNFFERTVAAYQHGVEGDVAFDEDF